MQKLVSIIGFVLLVFNSCNTQKMPHENQNDFEIISKESFGSVENQNIVYAGNSTKFANQWFIQYQNLSPIPTVPNVDFTKKNVCFVNLGTFYSGNHLPDFIFSEIKNKKLYLTLQFPKTMAGEAEISVLSHPFFVISYSKEIEEVFVREK